MHPAEPLALQILILLWLRDVAAWPACWSGQNVSSTCFLADGIVKLPAPLELNPGRCTTPPAPTACHENWWYLATCQSLIPSELWELLQGASGSQVGSMWAPANITSPWHWETWMLATGLFPATDTLAYHAWKREQTGLSFGPQC